MRLKVFSMIVAILVAYLMMASSIAFAGGEFEKIPITEDAIIGKWEAEWKAGNDSGTMVLTINDTESISYRVKSNISGTIWKFKNQIQKFDASGIECGPCNKTITDTYELFRDKQGSLILKGDVKIVPLGQIVEITARKVGS